MVTAAIATPSSDAGLRARMVAALSTAEIRWMLRPGRSVILDVETTDLHGAICEIAVIDTCGDTLLDTLVNPGRPITPAAAAVHGITAGEVAEAPSWTQVLPQLIDVVDRRRVIAYNAPFDREAVDAMTREVTDPGTPGLQVRWWCAMRARARVERSPYRRLGGGHRALGDVQATLEVLEGLARPARVRGMVW